VLGNSGAAGEWRLCAGAKCRTLSDIFRNIRSVLTSPSCVPAIIRSPDEAKRNPGKVPGFRKCSIRATLAITMN